MSCFYYYFRARIIFIHPFVYQSSLVLSFSLSLGVNVYFQLHFSLHLCLPISPAIYP